MEKQPIKVGFALCGSFCTHDKAMEALEQAAARYEAVYPIVSERCADTDTRFGAAHDRMREMERICGRRVIDSVVKAEPIGPQKLLDVLVICPCTGNTLAKLACGITDSAVTMAAKAHLRNGRPLVIAPSTNDGLSASAKNIGVLQDDPWKKPTSLVADFRRVCDAVDAALEGKQLQPVLVGRD